MGFWVRPQRPALERGLASGPVSAATWSAWVRASEAIGGMSPWVAAGMKGASEAYDSGPQGRGGHSGNLTEAGQGQVGKAPKRPRYPWQGAADRS